jgi:MYXO-CTERM domain-containing protein
MKLALAAGDLDGTPMDMDMYKIIVTEPSLLTAEIFSDNRFAAPFDFDSVLLLLDAGGAPITMNDDVLYDGDTYNAGIFQQDDSYLLNIPIAPGIYHLLVHPSPASSIPPGVGDAYWLAVGTAPIPEPTLLGVLAVGGALAVCRRRRL